MGKEMKINITQNYKVNGTDGKEYFNSNSNTNTNRAKNVTLSDSNRGYGLMSTTRNTRDFQPNTIQTLSSNNNINSLVKAPEGGSFKEAHNKNTFKSSNLKDLNKTSKSYYKNSQNNVSASDDNKANYTNINKVYNWPPNEMHKTLSNPRLGEILNNSEEVKG
eukprot:CAMPEP_0170532644 /NCGR_PEP_ID=MMETSP0209-20121228/74157_1 /TAXON_ID=665100 ORGANISM="Litonotus pictus, Strain P1" /NCGR_SAMPLE_ID=MMETSP0209 /ASSEMBLY_ACC=CAM_ASM_000301 /LENGTH=162 /DNA_ID=CAMNT_0010829063 /DNA_START=123 /DNA_END=608 /DNA_ORIENTATION=-